jgi:hypothetical protein
MEAFEKQKESLLGAVNDETLLLILSAPAGDYQMADTQVKIMPTGMCERHFVSRNTGHLWWVSWKKTICVFCMMKRRVYHTFLSHLYAS